MANALPDQLLMIDDDSTVGQAIEGPLSSYKVTVFNSQDLETALYQFNNQEFDVVFVELDFSLLNGLALVQKFRDHDSIEKRSTSFVLMSGKTRPASDDNLLKELMDVETIIKPFAVVNILPYLSRGKATKQRLRKYEMFRAQLMKMVKEDQVDEAIAQAKQALSQFGPKGIQLICDIFENAKQFETGLNFMTPICDKEPGVVLYQYLKGRFLKLLGRFEEAKELLELSYKKAPHHIKRLKDLGEIYLNLNEADEAVTKMKELLKLCPEKENIKFDMFKDLQNKGFDEQAREFCKETTKPMEVIRYYNNLGVQLSRQNDVEGAIREYERALKLFPTFKENYRIHYNIALAQMKLKTKSSYIAATYSLEKCLKINPNFEKAQNTLATVTKALNKKSA